MTLDMKDLAPILISSLAFLVSAYGIVERRIASQHALRIRLSELTDSLNSLDVDNVKAGTQVSQSGAMLDQMSLALNTRRALLTRQATSLLEDFRRTITAEEYEAIAASLYSILDVEAAEQVWSSALTAVEKQSTLQRAITLRGYAAFKFARNDYEAGRDAYEKAIALFSPVDDPSKWTLVDCYLRWASSEADAPVEQRRDPAELLKRAEDIANSIWNTFARQQALRSVENERSQVLEEPRATEVMENETSNGQYDPSQQGGNV